MKSSAVSFKAGPLQLEGILTMPGDQGGPFPGVVLCHSHPFLGGSQDQPLLHAVSGALARCGVASLAFNFRGVGHSEGVFSNGKEEGDDAAWAVRVLKHWPGILGSRVGLVGHSFGASVALSSLPKLKDVKALALLAPTVSSLVSPSLASDRRAKLFLVCSRDRITPPDELERKLELMKGPFEFRIIEGGDHTFRGCEDRLSELLADFFSRTLIGTSRLRKSWEFLARRSRRP
ncbi:MAG: alpha/beta hydrolase [Chloroflexi bacterium]|nr:alpha/beta hydrolase [Chloroflexota bacterium]